MLWVTMNYNGKHVFLLAAQKAKKTKREMGTLFKERIENFELLPETLSTVDFFYPQKKPKQKTKHPKQKNNQKTTPPNSYKA